VGVLAVRSRAVRVAAVAAAVSLICAGAAQAAPRWNEGLIEKSTITNCVSIIGGYPYSEEGAWSWTGFWADPNDLPNVGEVFYVHSVFAAVGNACSGQYGYPEFKLPSGVSLAISSQTPVICYAVDFTKSPPAATRETQACRQQPSQGFYGGSYGFGPLTQSSWPMPQGKGWEIQVPVVSNRTLNGIAANPCDCVEGYTKIIDGNSSPVLNPEIGVFAEPGPSTPGGGGVPGAGTGTGTGTTTGTTTQQQQQQGTDSTTDQTTPPEVDPQSSPLGSYTAPASFKLGTAARRGLPVTVENRVAGSTIAARLVQGRGSGRALARLSARSFVAAKVTKRNAPAGNVRLALKLTKKAQRRFRRSRRVKLTLLITVTPPGGSAATVSKPVTLKR
jgi:hypothetical protein